MSEPSKQLNTLFDTSWFADATSKSYRPYSVCLEQEKHIDPCSVDETELSVFAHVVEHEVAGYESRGYLSGPIEVSTNYTDPFAGRSVPSVDFITLPTVAEKDWVEIKNCASSDVLLVDDFSVFQSLSQSAALRSLGILLMTGCGIPRSTVRRFLHRFRFEFGMRIHLLTDNDTWGYFIYSLLLRGAMAPHATFPWLAVDEVNFVGLRVNDWSATSVPAKALRPWKDEWTSRITALHNYECFRSKAWAEELAAFQKRACALNLCDLIEAVGGTDAFVGNYLLPRLG